MTAASSGSTLLLANSTAFVFSALTHCILVDSLIVIYSTNLFVILGVSGLFCHIFYFLMENLISKQ